MGPQQVLLLRARVNLEVIIMKGFSTFPKFPIVQSTGAIEYTDTKKYVGEVPVMLEFWGNAEYLFTTIAPRPTLARKVAPKRVLSMGQIELHCEFMLN